MATGVLLAGIGFLPACEVARVDCASGDGSCNSSIAAALFQTTRVIAIAGSGGQIWVSRDGGATYQEIIPGDPAASYSHIKIADERQIVVGGTNSTGPYIIDSERLDTNWNSAFNTPDSPSLAGLDVSDDGAYGACGSNVTQAEFYYSNEPGIWSTVQPPVGTPGSCFYFNGAFYATISNTNFLHIRQSDGSFAPVLSDGSVTTIDGVAINGASAVLIDTPNDRAFLTTNGGVTWNTFSLGASLSCREAAYGNGRYATYCATGPSIYVSQDGQSWAATGVNPGSVLSTISSLSFADGYFYITGQNGSGNAAVYRTVDFFSYELSFEGPAGTAGARDELPALRVLVR